MTPTQDLGLLARKLSRVSPLVNYATALSEKVDGTQLFVFAVKRMLTTEEMVSICRDMATVIRHDLPERPDGWAASIHAEQYGSLTMGIYFTGWAGRPDKWHLHEGQERKATDAADWLALRERLRVALTELGVEGDHVGESGDFFLSDAEIRPRMIIVYIKRPEFLTKELITVLQNVLSDGYADWVVDVSPAFPAPFEELLRGIEVRADSVTDMWDRQEVEKLLGDRLKIPRYARDDG